MPSIADLARDLASFVDAERRADIAKAAAVAFSDAGFSNIESLAYAEYADLGVGSEVPAPAKALIRKILAAVRHHRASDAWAHALCRRRPRKAAPLWQTREAAQRPPNQRRLERAHASTAGAAPVRAQATVTVHVDLAPKLKELGLGNLPQGLRPPSTAVDLLASDIARRAPDAHFAIPARYCARHAG